MPGESLSARLSVALPCFFSGREEIHCARRNKKIIPSPYLYMHLSPKTARLVLVAALLFAGVALFLSYRARGKADSRVALCFSAAAILLGIAIWAAQADAPTDESYSPTSTGSVGALDPHAVSVVTLSADSWCPYCKQMSAQEGELRAAMQAKGYAFRLVSDTADKEGFDKLSKAHGARAFPHTLVFKAGEKAGEFPGFVPVAAFLAKIEAAVTS